MGRAAVLALALGDAIGGAVGGQAYPPYNESDAVDHYHYALVAFCNKTAIERWSCGPLCNSLPTPERSIFIGPGKFYDVQGYVAVFPSSDGLRSCSVGFRGSQPGNLHNAAADVSAWAVSWPPSRQGVDTSWCPSCRVYAGFASAHDELSDEVRAALAELNCTTATFHGHSLGGAMAGLSSMMTRGENAVTVPDVWTYGMPRVGNKAFVQAYVDLAAAHSASPPMWRIVHFNDLVPRVNPRWNYWSPRHVPGEVYYRTEPFPGPFDVCPPEHTDDPSSENRTCMDNVPWYELSQGDHMLYLGVDFDIARNEQCGFEDTVKPGFGAVVILIGTLLLCVLRVGAGLMSSNPLLLLVVLLLVCACACRCCSVGGCCYHNCKRVASIGRSKIGLDDSSRPLIELVTMGASYEAGPARPRSRTHPWYSRIGGDGTLQMDKDITESGSLEQSSQQNKNSGMRKSTT